MTDQHIEWLDEPKDDSYDAGLSYLTLVFGNASDIVERFRKATMTRFQAKEVFRASGFPLLVISNSHVRKELNKIAAGKKISPMFLVRREGRKAVIADGYHRMCAVYSLDEDALIPCTIVGAAGGSPQRREGIPIQSVSGVCAAHDTDDADFFGCQEKPV